MVYRKWMQEWLSRLNQIITTGKYIFILHKECWTKFIQVICFSLISMKYLFQIVYFLFRLLPLIAWCINASLKGMSKHKWQLKTEYLNIRVLRNPHNVVTQALLVNTLYLKQGMSWAQWIIHHNSRFLQCCHILAERMQRRLV